jgi:hypothetical protein
MNKPSAFTLNILVPDGDPDGLRIISNPNWTGKGLIFPRALFGEVSKLDELTCTGVYILWGPGESGQLLRVYIGEGDPVLDRLDQHARKKDFWTHAAVFISKDKNLNKAYAKYLEARLVKLAADAKRAELNNTNEPRVPVLSEYDKAVAEEFLANLLLCLPIIGISAFEKVKGVGKHSDELILKGKKIEARGQETTDGFVVFAGSQAVKKKDEAPSILGYLRELRSALVKQGVLEDAGSVYRFTQDYIFSSPSTAAGVILGRSANGRDEWKDGNGRTLKEIQDAALK